MNVYSSSTTITGLLNIPAYRGDVGDPPVPCFDGGKTNRKCDTSSSKKSRPSIS